MGAPQDSIALNTRDQDWTTLIRNSARGDQSALGELYDATSRLVFGLVLRIVGDRASAEEVLLDVYTQAWRQAANYDEARGAPLAWLMTIARSRAIDRIRSSKHDQQKDPLDAVAEISDREPSPEQATVDSERRQLVRAALETLPAEQREVLELAYYSGLSHSEIASRLGQPLGTVKTRTRLAMIKLRDMLRPVLEGEV
ncbi:MAG TPA: sigma-70 family RNA polymerase sigma factor [Blastocatellia bacterium]|nr:sigma-70 family RNA polymerase sigma factor [Blastocatellia bacterium]